MLMPIMTCLDYVIPKEEHILQDIFFYVYALWVIDTTSVIQKVLPLPGEQIQQKIYKVTLGHIIKHLCDTSSELCSSPIMLWIHIHSSFCNC